LSTRRQAAGSHPGPAARRRQPRLRTGPAPRGSHGRAQGNHAGRPGRSRYAMPRPMPRTRSGRPIRVSPRPESSGRYSGLSPAPAWLPPDRAAG